MPLEEPPSPRRLRGLPRWRLARRRLWRVYRAVHGSPWSFAACDRPAEDCGRFDLPLPEGACYLGRSKIAAVLEALQSFGRGLVPAGELARRRAAAIDAPADAPAAAWLTAAAARGAGVTAALWAGGDRERTQHWARELRRAGWAALYHGIQHDPGGQQRAVTLFDRAGAHPPLDDEEGWPWRVERLDDDPALARGLGRYGLTVERGDVELPLVDPEDIGLWT